MINLQASVADNSGEIHMSDLNKGVEQITGLIREGGAQEAADRMREAHQQMSPAEWNKFSKSIVEQNQKDVSNNLPVVKLVDLGDTDKDGKNDLQMQTRTHTGTHRLWGRDSVTGTVPKVTLGGSSTPFLVEEHRRKAGKETAPELKH